MQPHSPLTSKVADDGATDDDDDDAAAAAVAWVAVASRRTSAPAGSRERPLSGGTMVSHVCSARRWYSAWTCTGRRYQVYGWNEMRCDVVGNGLVKVRGYVGGGPSNHHTSTKPPPTDGTCA